jgi:anti-anti-sigma regulatory factor
VTEIDSCGVQLLLAARRTARENDCELEFAAPSAAVLDVLTTFDLTGMLDAGTPNNERGANAAMLTVDHADGA